MKTYSVLYDEIATGITRTRCLSPLTAKAAETVKINFVREFLGWRSKFKNVRVVPFSKDHWRNELNAR